jgi:Ca2+-binding RTX toxin-like protein
LVSIVNGRIVYNPNGLPAAHIDPATLQDVPAVDSFTYVLADEFGATAAATVTVTVRPFDLTTANDVVNFATDGHNHTVNAVIGAPGTATLNSGDQLTGGAGSDTLAIVGDNAAFSLASLATFSGFEAVRLDGTGESLTLRNGASLTVNGGSGNTVTLSTSGDVVRFAGGSNTVNATIGGTLNAGDSLTGGSGVDTLVLTNGGTANLNALAAFAGFEAVRLAGTGETLVLRNGVDLAVAAGSNNTVTLGTGSDAVTFAGGTNTVNATAATLNAGDRLLGGSNTDTLALSGAGSFDLSALATFSGFEAVALDRNLGETLVLRNGVNLAVTGASNDTVTLGTGNETVSFTGGTNTVNAVIGTGATLGAADRLSGGGGTDTLALTGDGGALDLNTLATFTGFERVSLGGAGEILTLRNGTSLTVLGGHGNAVVLGSGSDTVSFTDGANTVTAATATLNGGDSLAGGTGTDTLVLTGGGSFNLNAIAGLSGFETVSLTQPATLILRNGAGLAATGSAAGDTITGGTGNDTIAGAGGADSLSGGAGADHFVYTAAGGGAQSSVQTGLDVIADFAHGTDKIDLNGFAFTPLEKALTADAAVNGFTGGSVANYFHAAAADGPAIKVEYLNGTTQAQVYVDVNRDGNFDKATDIAIHLNNIAATAHLTLGDFSFG